MPRLLLVSNRLPVTVTRGPAGITVERSVGGLATALREPHERSRGLWIGWPGPTDALDAPARAELRHRLASLSTVPVFLSTHEITRFYETFANGVLWPLFHYLPGQVPLVVEGWEEYCSVNTRYAETVAEHYLPGDVVWVHDYQLMLVPELLRRVLPDARIGFFLHTPFPSSELFATLPYRAQLLRGLLGADVVGFHTEGYQRHFASAVRRVLGVTGSAGRLAREGRSVQLGAFPIGIDANAIDARARHPDVTQEVGELRRDADCRILVGIDRLDYTKGIPRRLLAYEQMLTRWPELRGRVRLLQVAVPSRTGVRAYRRFRQEVDAQVGHINGLFGTTTWMPLHYLYRPVPHHQLLALYRAADVMLVTPIRDGMNLVAKEFVAARSDEDGVLVLSEFAGAAAELSDALHVNPYDIGQSAECYRRALAMPQPERRARMRTLRQRVFEYDVYRWVESFLHSLTGVSAEWTRGAGAQARDS